MKKVDTQVRDLSSKACLHRKVTISDRSITHINLGYWDGDLIVGDGSVVIISPYLDWTGTFIKEGYNSKVILAEKEKTL